MAIYTSRCTEPISRACNTLTREFFAYSCWVRRTARAQSSIHIRPYVYAWRTTNDRGIGTITSTTTVESVTIVTIPTVTMAGPSRKRVLRQLPSSE